MASIRQSFTWMATTWWSVSSRNLILYTYRSTKVEALLFSEIVLVKWYKDHPNMNSVENNSFLNGGHFVNCQQRTNHRAYHSWQLAFRNPVDCVKSGGFHVKTWHSLPTALHKTEEFFLKYLIYKFCRWISPEIHIKSTRFHLKSTWNLLDFTWNPLDFMKSAQNLADFTWNLLDFMKSIWNLADFTWNLLDFTWNPLDFTWNPLDFMKSRMWAFGWSPSIGLFFERPNMGLP